MRPSRTPMPRLSSSPMRARFARCCTLSAVMASAISSVTAAVCLARKLKRIVRSGLFGFAAEALQLVVQCLDCHAEDLGGPCLVVARVYERELDQSALGFIHGHAGRQPHE